MSQFLCSNLYIWDIITMHIQFPCIQLSKLDTRKVSELFWGRFWTWIYFCYIGCWFNSTKHHKKGDFQTSYIWLSKPADHPLLSVCLMSLHCSLLPHTHRQNHTCMHKHIPSISLSFSPSLLSPLPPTLAVFSMVPGCLEAVCICMGETVDRDGIWHAGTRSKRSIWSHENRREPSSHPYKTPTDSQLCQPRLLHLLSSLCLPFPSRFSSSPACCVPTSRPACLPDFAITPHDKQWPV